MLMNNSNDLLRIIDILSLFLLIVLLAIILKMKHFHHLEYLDYCLYCYIQNVLADVFFRYFMLNLRAHRKLQTKPSI